MKSPFLTPIFLLVLGGALLNEPYFPIKAKDGDPGVTKFQAEWWGKSLERMGEPRLPDLAQDESAVAFRILILPTWGNSIAVRVQKEGEIYRLAARRLNGQAGYDPGALVETKDFELSISDSRKLDSLLQGLDFFQMPTEDDVQGKDGSQWILEGVSNGKYHVVDRWSATHYGPDKRKLRAFLDFFRFLLDKSTLSERPSNKGQKLM